MYKLKEMILMLCFILSGALCYASSEARMEKEKGEGITYVFQRLGYYYDYYKEGYGIRYIFP